MNISDVTVSPEWQPAGRREWLGLAVLVLPTLLLALDMTVLHLAAPHLSADLQPTSSQLLWILDIYGFMVAGFLITMGTLGDRIGRRRLLLAGAFAFGLASVAAAFATSAGMLIATRALLGIAGATLMPSTLSLIRNMFHIERERTLAITIWMTGFIVGSAIGPLVGGLMLEFFWWGSVFLLAVPVMALLLIVGPTLLPEFRDEQAGRLDFASAVLCVTALLLVIFGLKDTARDGVNLLACAAAVAGCAIGFAFVRRQKRLADPMFDMALFRRRAFTVSVTAMMLSLLALSGSWLMIFQYLQGVSGLSALEAGLVMLPAAVIQTCASLLVPRVARGLRPAVFVSLGLGLAVVGLLVLLLVQGRDGIGLIVLGTVLLGVGIMPMMILGTDLVVSAAPKEKTGAAAATSETASELGMAMGIAVIGSVGAAVYRRHVAGELPAGLSAEHAEIAGDTIGGALAVSRQLPPELGEALLAVAQSGFAEALHANALIGAAIMAGTALLTALCLSEVKLEAGAH
ncbi:MFS transporter, DHA2 family, multidrug resistance protein [Halopseudomonas xinjiangensis]|uniref:MFS transporter, DHA2 family, multidrug resistance protein n=1 Tax=Halopseudomonas xinjiangensis TaxID=487184 RepID=A0A1H1PDJ6_9GAMM|nr:MFS transporter [Halopseudomonas xinjiangensis]SDS08679.1 MFS transporter, DHA2 family, multidrug resistance protein [Halopseudomonas xinjiangensis]